jgi:hypothetical protein
MAPILLLSIFLVCSCKQINKQSSDVSVTETEHKDDNQDKTDEIEENTPLIFSSTQQDFTLPEHKFEVVYVKSDSMFFYDIKSQKKKLFPETYPVFNMTFTPDGKTMYYIVSLKGVLFLKKAEFFDSQVKTTWLLDLKNSSQNFVSQTYFERSRIVCHNDTIYIETGYEWLAGFNKCIMYSVKDSSALFDQSNKVYSLMYKQQDANNKYLNEIRGNLIEKKINGITELFYKTENDSLQLTQTNHLDEEFFNDEAADEYTEPKSFSIIGISSDSSNLLVGVITTMGDLAHGPYFLVNIHGKGQVQICHDGFGSDMKPQWLTDGKNIAAIDLNHETNDNMLNITQDDYRLREIDLPVSYLAIRNSK